MSPWTAASGTVYDLCLVDTNVVSEVLKNRRGEAQSFLSRFVGGGSAPCFPFHVLVELRRRPDLFKEFLQIFATIPWFLLKPWGLVELEECDARDPSPLLNAFTPLGPNEAYDPQILDDYVRVRLMKLESEGAIDRVFRKQVMAYLESLLAKIEPDALARVWTHGDYAPYNIIVTPTRLVALDPDIGGYFAELENYCSRYEDIVHFHRFTKAMSRSMIISSDLRRELASTFLGSYRAAGEHDVVEHSAAFRAFELKYELLEVVGMAWPSLLARLSSRRNRLRRFRRWFESACDLTPENSLE